LGSRRRKAVNRDGICCHRGGPWHGPALWRPSVIACSASRCITIGNLITRLWLIQIIVPIERQDLEIEHGCQIHKMKLDKPLEFLDRRIVTDFPLGIRIAASFMALNRACRYGAIFSAIDTACSMLASIISVFPLFALAVIAFVKKCCMPTSITSIRCRLSRKSCS
jgi:hypothetical protein